MITRPLGLIYALTAILFSIVALLYCLTISPAYTSDALLIPKEQNNGGSSSGLATATRLLGLGGADQGSNFAKFQKYWGSRDVAATILEKHPDFNMKLFRYNWDSINNRWYNHPHNMRQYAAVPFNGLFGVNPNYAPKVDDLARSVSKTSSWRQTRSTSQIPGQGQYADAFAQHFPHIVRHQRNRQCGSAG